jgi:hypothetical protein
MEEHYFAKDKETLTLPCVRLRARILHHLSRQSDPKLTDIRIVCGLADFDAEMPEFMTAFLKPALAD